MKIRTGFVTNSSSNSQAEIVIDNLVLLEILQRYKEQGVFGEAKTWFEIGTYVESDWSEIRKQTIIPAFHYVEVMYGGGWSILWHHPESLEEVLNGIIKIIELGKPIGKDYDLILFEKMKEELNQKEAEILDSYSKVFWKHKNDTDPLIGYEYKWFFTYDPKNGERYEVEYYQGEDDD